MTVAIQDNDMGMCEQALPSLFILEKKRHLGTEGEKGTGPGLVPCKQCIEQLGGGILLEYKLEHGTMLFPPLPAA